MVKGNSMIKVMRSFVLSAAFTAAVAIQASAQDSSLSLTLSDAIRMAVEKNLEVTAERYNPAQLEADINRNKAIYDPVFAAKAAYDALAGPSASAVWAGATDGERTTLNSSISQLLSTGATVSLDFNNGYDDNNSPITQQAYWQSGLGVTLSQPLLKKFGRENTDLNINVSRLSRYATIERFNTRLLNTVAQVRSEYYKLYNLRELLEVKKVSLDLARNIVLETKARVAADVLPAMEILNAEFGVVSREKDLFDAEKSVSDQMDVLRLLLQIEGEGDIVTADLPRQAPIQVNEKDAIKRALTLPDIMELKRNLEITELQSRIYKNNLAPDLSLTASASLIGIGSNFARDMEKLGNADQSAWNVGLIFTYPLGNNSAKNDYRKSRLKADQTLVQIRSLEERSANSVKSAIRGIKNSYKQIGVADRGRAYAEERLKAYIPMNEAGLVTIKDVLDVENDLAAAKSNQVTAAVNYDNAITLLWQVTGELLEREGIKQSDEVGHDLYLNVSW